MRQHQRPGGRGEAPAKGLRPSRLSYSLSHSISLTGWGLSCAPAVAVGKVLNDGAHLVVVEPGVLIQVAVVVVSRAGVRLAAVEREDFSLGGAPAKLRLGVVDAELVSAIGLAVSPVRARTEAHQGSQCPFLLRQYAGQEGEDVLALGGHATAGVEGTGPGCVGGVIFTPDTQKLRGDLSLGNTPRVLFATSAPSFAWSR